MKLEKVRTRARSMQISLLHLDFVFIGIVSLLEIECQWAPRSESPRPKQDGQRQQMNAL